MVGAWLPAAAWPPGWTAVLPTRELWLAGLPGLSQGSGFQDKVQMGECAWAEEMELGVGEAV